MNEINTFSKLTDFPEKLSRLHIGFTIEYRRENSVMVLIPVPGERWEVEYFTNGEVEIERFISTGKIEKEGSLSKLVERFSK